MAEAFDVAVAPPCPLAPIAFAASVQLDDLVDPGSFRLEDGQLAIPDGP